jgi:hypothetical protein
MGRSKKKKKVKEIIREDNENANEKPITKRLYMWRRQFNV